ncbi:hypothetical protein MED121_18535 [Marinomonas sp. MED121]|uniref:S8 family peptidase n=1 Tax=Marinomonas sp. MED121 TaxID=314277 RepID=UPI0000690D56|nr:S8 family peptidase [Marinomonas sp. MED121]EAQ65266.1 hypothetical protein MED121_18535 [Marinomonas sp. MED121]
MERKPILTFRKPNTDRKRDKLSPPRVQKCAPSEDKQKARIFSKIETLEIKFAENIKLSDSPEGMLPEKVLVLEVAGDIQNLALALAKVEGFEFIASELLDSSYQDENFYLKQGESLKPTSKNAYLTMSSQAGLLHLKAIWNQYLKTGDIKKGLTPLREAFLHLIDIRIWGTKDRLESTHLLEDWAYKLEDVEHGYDDLIPFEIELWYRENSQLRINAEHRIKKLIQLNGGEVSSCFAHAGIGYHAILGKLPVSGVQEIIKSSGKSVELMRCDDVMFFRPLGQCLVPKVIDSDSQMNFESNTSNDDVSEHLQPIVALFDGLPLSNHEALKNRLIIDDPDDFEALYSSPMEQVHGTSMASLIIHGDLNKKDEPSLDRPLYVRPILAPGSPHFDGMKSEKVPDNYLPIDLMHRAVIRMKVGDEGAQPTAPDVLVINLSVGDPYRRFDIQMSPWARMLDWLSYKYDVLFVVSAGNMAQSICLEGIKERDFQSLQLFNMEEHFIKAIAKQKYERRMMSPAESINALTIKAEHSDDFVGKLPPNQIDILETKKIFSPINPISLGKKNSIKPELMMPGGRLTYRNKSYLAEQDIVLEPVVSTRFGPGQKTALPSSVLGSVNSYGYTAGTSNAAALATRRIAFLYETLKGIKDLGDSEALSHAPDALILKALLAHGAEYSRSLTDVISKYLKDKSNSNIFKSELNQFIGFGNVNEQRIHACQNNQATLIYTGVIKNDAGHEYKMPLPKSLASQTSERRLIVTIAWFSPVNHGHQDYRGAQLWATSSKEDINAQSSDYYHHYLKNGTLYHDVRKGDKASVFTEGDQLTIQVHCMGRAGISNIEIPYALVVTLDTPGENIPIYEEVKQGLSIAAEQTA